MIIQLMLLLGTSLIGVHGQGVSQTSTKTTTVTYPRVSLNCDFEKDFCNWKNYSDSNGFFWQRNKANELLDINGPLPDHTLQSLNGHYIFIQSNPSRLQNESTSLVSAPLTIRYSYTTYCFKFWFHMHGEAINSLFVTLENMDAQNSTVIWSKQTSQGNQWRLGQATLKLNAANYRFIIKGVVDGNLLGDIAIDDIDVSSGSCSTPKFCDFESDDICGFSLNPVGIFNWTWHQGSTSTYGTGPSFDHTTLTSNGHYMFIESSYPRNQGDNAIILSPTYRSYTSGTRCVQIWYHAYGSDVGSFNVYKLEKGTIQGKYEKLFSISGNQGDEWHVAQINLYVRSFQDYNIVFEGVIGDDGWYDYGWSGGRGDISIDDYELREKACEPMGDCDFEEDTCAWKNAEKNADFEWVRNRGSTPSAFSGPSVDHTLGTSLGTYLFIETSSQSKPGSKALMVSPVFDKFTTRCFEFYYHMKGSSSTLSVIQKGFRSYLNGTVVWKDSSSDKDTWQQALISLPNNYSSNYILILEGKINGQNSGDIAVDDLKILNGNLCPSPESQCAFQCPNGNCLSDKKVCNFVKDCAGGEDELDCGYNNVTFETGTSNWNDTSGISMLKWTRKNNGIGNEPLTDHTLNAASGFFMLLSESSNGTSEKSAQFSSPIMRDSSSSCQMKLWYQINGNKVGGIDIYINVGSQKSRALRIDKETYNQWVQTTVNIGRYLSEFQILVEGYRIPRSTGAIAFDDINFINCGIIIKNVSCSYSETKCDNKNCVSTSRQCDFNDDCGDMSDEKNQTCIAYPFRCTFETSFCEWVPSSDNSYNWQRTTGYNWPSRLAPQRDHTTNTAAGSYIYINTTGRHPSSTSVLFGPVISTDSTSCRMRFFYYMSGRSAGKLSIKSRTHIGGSFKYQWSRTGTIADYWERAEAYLYSSSFYSKNYQLIIEAEVAYSNSQEDGIIAIDDISFSKECIPSTDPMEVTQTTARPPLCGYDGFRCSNGKCINKTQLCNFINDCSSGEDEANCGICNFEKNTCGWYDNSFGGHIFNRTTAANAKISKDVTLGSINGSLMSYEASEGAFSGLSRLYSPIFGRASSYCEFEFYYLKQDVSDTNPNEFSLFLVDSFDRTERLWRTKKNSPNNDWTRMTIGLHSRDPGFKLYFESSFTNQQSDQKPILAIDETNFINCQTQFNVSCFTSNVFRCNGSYSYCIPNSLICDFNNDCVDKSDEKASTCANYTRCDFENELNPLCQWTNDNDADLKWKRAVGKQFLTSSLNYPTYDHTTLESDGHYFYNDYSGKPNKISRLSSPLFYPVSANCSLRLWYYMIDEDESGPVLKVYMRTMIGGPLVLLWEKNNLNALEWILADIPLQSGENFQVVIEAVNGNAQIAIDDLSFTPSCKINTIDQLPNYVFTTPKPDSTCPSPNQIRCQTSNECIFTKDLCNFRYDCDDKTDELSCPWTCNFDGDNNNLCSWNNLPKDSDQLLTIKWNVGKASQFKNTGPLFDHSTLSADGSILYFDPAGELEGHKARIISPVYNQAGLMCSFEFWYQLYGDSTSTLSVYILTGLAETLIATLQSGKTDQWTNFKASLPTCVQQFQVIVEGARGQSNSSFIFIDDIRFTNCEYQRPIQTCSSDQFKCNSFHCVSSSNVCDLANDCCDRSDEQECTNYYKCNFEKDMCGFKSSNASSARWLITRPDSLIIQNGPFYDHSTQTYKGHYLVVSSRLIAKEGDNAFVSIGVRASQDGCKMRLWHFLSGEMSGLLAVWWRKEVYGQLFSLFSTNKANNRWERIDINIPVMAEFELVIEGVRARSGIIAIDDITFTPQCQIDADLELPSAIVTPSTENENVTIESTTEKIGKEDASANKFGLIIGIGVSIVLVVVLAVIGFFFWKKRKSSSSQTTVDMSGLINKNFEQFEQNY